METQTEEEMDKFNELPEEIRLKCLEYLDKDDLLEAMLVNKM
jgi:hypothetical protein